jgi:hypothetical protein
MVAGRMAKPRSDIDDARLQSAAQHWERRRNFSSPEEHGVVVPITRTETGTGRKPGTETGTHLVFRRVQTNCVPVSGPPVFHMGFGESGTGPIVRENGTGPILVSRDSPSCQYRTCPAYLSLLPSDFCSPGPVEALGQPVQLVADPLQVGDRLLEDVAEDVDVHELGAGRLVGVVGRLLGWPVVVGGDGLEVAADLVGDGESVEVGIVGEQTTIAGRDVERRVADVDGAEETPEVFLDWTWVVRVVVLVGFEDGLGR